MDWDGTVVWQFANPAGTVFHHDWERLPNGNTLILCYQDILVPAISPVNVQEDFILEVNPAGDIVWEWHISDHFDQLGLSQDRIDRIYEVGGDWSHVNTVAAIPENTSHTDPRFSPGNIVISIRHQNTVAIIDRVTGEVVWTLADATIGQHMTHMLPDDVPGGGNILVFDNGSGGNRVYGVVPSRYYSRVVEIDPTTDTLPWVYTAESSGLSLQTFYSSLTCGAQRMANGNTVIFESKWGRVFEVTPAGQTVWEYMSPYVTDAATGSTLFYRAYKVPLEWAGPLFVPDLVVTMDANPDPAQIGGDLDYSIQVQNAGSEPAVNVEISQPTPVGTTFRSVSAPLGWSCSTPAVGGTGSVTCTGSELSAGEAAALSLVVRADLCQVDGADISGTVTASSMGTDMNPTDNVATVVTPGASDALVSDLTVDLVNGGSDIHLGWGDWASGCGYRVLRATSPGGGFTDVSGPLTVGPYVDAGAGTAPGDYYYLIRVD
jgi:uncharacterized repeat protein (TIGR01451 family)